MESKKTYIEPFKMHNNIYFVGSTKVSVHIIETEEGLVMIDTGYPDMYEDILYSMNKLGFDPKDICAIFHSHGHIDHFGCTIQFKEISGAKTYISRIDNDIVNGTYDLSWAKEAKIERLPYFDCDVLIEDGDVFTFGKTSIRCRLTPGHTDGVMSFFITTEGDDVVAAMHGGIGMNTLRASFLNAYGFSFENREIFRRGLHALADEKVDLVLGNHPGQSGTVEKLQKVKNGESAIDPTQWKRFLKWVEANLDEVIKSEKQL